MRRQAHADEIDGIVAGWVAARPFAEVMDTFEQAEVAVAPVYDAAQLLADEHLAARGTFVRMDDPDLGTMTVQAPVVRIGDMPGRIDFLGRSVGEDNDAIFGELLGLGRGAPGRVALRGPHLNATEGADCVTTPSPTIGAGHAGQQ